MEDNFSDDDAKLGLLPRRDPISAFDYQPPPTPPPILSDLPYPYDDDPPPHPASFMLTFLIILTCGLLLITLISAYATTEPNPNFSPFLTLQSISPQSISLSSGDRVTADLAVAMSLHNRRRRHVSVSYSSIRASVFQNCALVGESERADGWRRVSLAPGNSTELRVVLRGVRLGVGDWVVDERGSERSRAMGVASLGLKVEMEDGAAGERVEMRCGTVNVGFSTEPVAGKLLFGPAGCWRVTGNHPPPCV